jgi:hypothetical protein
VNTGFHKIKDKEKKRTAWKCREGREKTISNKQEEKKEQKRIYSKNPENSD